MKSDWRATRRHVLKLGLSAIAVLIPGAGFSAARAAGRRATPSQAEGPFYPIRDQADKDADLVHIKGREGEAAGDRIAVRGRIVDEAGAPIPGVLVEIWHANKWGRYDHRRDRNSAPLDPDFQGWGQQLSREDGGYLFQTIFPGIYPAAPGWNRPPHIHFKLMGQGVRALTTQMYFPGQELNAKDLLLQRLPPSDQALLIAKKDGAYKADGVQVSRFIFDIVLG